MNLSTMEKLLKTAPKVSLGTKILHDDAKPVRYLIVTIDSDNIYCSPLSQTYLFELLCTNTNIKHLCYSCIMLTAHTDYLVKIVQNNTNTLKTFEFAGDIGFDDGLVHQIIKSLKSCANFLSLGITTNVLNKCFISELEYFFELNLFINLNETNHNDYFISNISTLKLLSSLHIVANYSTVDNLKKNFTKMITLDKFSLIIKKFSGDNRESSAIFEYFHALANAKKINVVFQTATTSITYER